MIDPDEIQRIAGLARLELDPDECELFARQFGDILGFVRQLEELDVSSVEPAVYAVDISNALRPDEPANSLAVDEVLANNPGDDRDHFRVPKILGDGAVGEGSA